ncbi:hypothetical protein [Cystobacter fuscus]|uniref:hypothetical protein n=1 Tax=Cystobacter fuscus TaxID=43 RepID=UPI0012FE7C85|nr:hypothetical protein [Cystobacter fuscus]
MLLGGLVLLGGAGLSLLLGTMVLFARPPGAPPLALALLGLGVVLFAPSPS